MPSTPTSIKVINLIKLTIIIVSSTSINEFKNELS